MRLNDGHDPLHGPRGAALARELRGGPFELEDAEMDLLAFACEEHTNGGVGPNPTGGVCWDADRLNLWRVGSKPDPRFLSTQPARSEERIAWALSDPVRLSVMQILMGGRRWWRSWYRRRASPSRTSPTI